SHDPAGDTAGRGHPITANAAPAAGLIESPGVDILLEHPQIQTGGRWPVQDGLGRPGEQSRADAAALVAAADVQVVEQRAPSGVLVEEGIREADQAARLGENGAAPRISL